MPRDPFETVDMEEPPPNNGRDAAPLAITIASSLAGKPVPEREWLVPDWIPAHEVTLLSGDGGVGKSMLAMQLQIAVSAGTTWLGLPVPTPGPSIGFYAEDTDDELHRRLVTLAELMLVDVAGLTGMAWRCAVDDNTELVTVDDRGNCRPTPYFHTVEVLVLNQGSRLVVFDAVTNFFGGDEIRRRQVNGFLRLFGQFARRTGAAVLLLAHPSLAGIANGSGISGSTHWNNAARSRLYFAKQTGEDADPYERELTHPKANYAAAGSVLRVHWERGGFVALGDPTGVDRAAMNSRADRVFKSLLTATYAEGTWTSANLSARNYAPSIFAKHPDREGLGKSVLEAAMLRLKKAGTIKTETYGRQSDPRSRLAPV